MDLEKLTEPGGPDSPDPVLERKLRESLSPNYVLMGHVDSGGMGSIYLARDPVLGRLVAVKVLSRAFENDREARERFSREAQAMAALSHPNTISVYTVGSLSDGLPYFVMEYVEGGSLAERVASEGPLSLAETRRILGDVARALSAAHRRGIVHRDVKASNVLYDRNLGRVLVSDFGVAAVSPAASASPDSRLTQKGSIIGSPQFMSPEQLAGDTVTAASDVYSLGLLAFELLTGHGPFLDASTPTALVVAHLREDPARLSTLRPDTDPELDELIDRCLAKAAQDRPQASEVARALAPATDSVLEWPPPGLKPLQGASQSVARPLVTGMGLLLASIWLGSLPNSFAPLYALSVVGGLFLFLRGVFRLSVVARHSYRGIKLGFGWTTLAEVAADKRGDTGRLIAGAREYVTATPEERAAFRVGRLRKAALELSSVLMLAPASAMGLWLGPVLATTGSAAVVLVGPSVFLLALAFLATQAERRKVARARRELKRRRAPIGVLGPLVEPWYDVFDRMRAGEGPGRGIVGRRLSALAIFGAAGVATVVVALSFASVGVLTVWTEEHFEPVQFGATQERINEVRPARALRLTPDPSLSGRQAARLWHEAMQIDESEWWDSIGTARSMQGSGLVVGESNPYDSAHALVVDSLILVASRGLTSAEVRYLEGFASDPRLPALSRVARASAFNDLHYIELETGEPLYGPDVESWWHLRDRLVPRYSGVRVAAYNTVARAALAVARGDIAAAETTLLETLTFGLLLSDESVTLIGNLIGVVVTNIGLRNLRTLYAITGQPDKAQLIAPVASPDSVTLRSIPHPAQTDDFLKVMSDGRGPWQLKLEALQDALALYSCGSARGLLLGFPPDAMEQLAGPIRSSIVPHDELEPAYNAILDWEKRLAESDRELPTPYGATDNPAAQFVGSFGMGVGRVLNHDRLTACFMLLRDLT